jgi:hypothetical protein
MRWSTTSVLVGFFACERERYCSVCWPQFGDLNGREGDQASRTDVRAPGALPSARATVSFGRQVLRNQSDRLGRQQL